MKNERPLNLKTIIYSALVLFGISACSSPVKLLENGNYDQSINLAIRKLKGKDKKKVKYVQTLEDAFEKVTERDMRLAEQHRLNNSPQDWDKAFDIYRKIQKRQNRLEPLLPLVDEHGIKANFTFVRVSPLIEASRESAASAYYESGISKLEYARKGDRAMAKAAYNDLNYIKKYYPEYKDRHFLMDEANDLGVAHILVSLDEYSNSRLPYEVRNELLRLNTPKLNDKWKKYYTYQPANVEMDYQVLVRLEDLYVSPSQVNRREFEESREIENGFEYVLDGNGNVKKDSLGNDIKIPRVELVKANIVETFQNKSATIKGRIDFIDLNNNRLLDSESVNGDALFENAFVQYRGDERALSDETRKLLHLSFIPFPTDASLLFEIIDHMKPKIERKIERNRRIL